MKVNKVQKSSKSGVLNYHSYNQTVVYFCLNKRPSSVRKFFLNYFFAFTKMLYKCETTLHLVLIITQSFQFQLKIKLEY